MKFFMSVIGMVMIVEGLPYFAFPEKMKEMISMMLTFPDDVLRKFGAMLMLIGLGVVYFVNRVV